MSSSPSIVSRVPPSVDFVSSDFDALASHMRHCELAQGRWFGTGARLQRLRSMVAGRMVTVACMAALVVVAFAILA